MKPRTVVAVAWPSFLMAGVAQSLFFTLFDPAELSLLGEPLQWSRTAVYSMGFFLFWAVCAGSSAFTLLLQKSAAELNRPSLEPQGRPADGPGGEDARRGT